MAATEQRRPAAPPPDPEIRTLEIDDIPSLRLDRFGNERDIEDVLERFPGRSVWNPVSLEYLVVAPWRNRAEIGVVGDMIAIRSAEAMVRAAAERAAERGDALTLMLDLDEERPAGFYRRAGLDPIERIVTYDLRRGNHPRRTPGDVRFVRADPMRGDHMAALLEIDRAAFPWLWWNTPEEFRTYHRMPGVQIHLGLLAGRPVSYCGFTTFAGWAHLDRIAVSPAAQGQGIGRQTLAYAVDTLFHLRVDRIGLSTQELNARSRRLYEGFGFRRSPGMDYTLYGAAHRDPALALVDRSLIGDA